MQTTHVAQASTAAQATDYPQWVIVENAGTDTEDVWSDHHTFEVTPKELKSCGGTSNDFDLMKRLPDGIPTTGS